MKDQDYGDFARLAMAVTTAPMSLVGVLDRGQNWILSWASETPSSPSAELVVLEKIRTKKSYFEEREFQGSHFRAGLPLTDEKGELIGAIAVFGNFSGGLTQDQIANLSLVAGQLAHRIRLERELRRESRIGDGHFLDSVIDNLPVALFCKDVQEGYSFSLWNKQSEKLFGLKKRDILGKNDYDLFPREQSDFFRKKDRETVEGGMAVEVLEEPVDSPVLGRRYVRTVKVPVKDKSGNPRYLLGISSDVTDSRESQRLIAEQQMQIVRSAKLSSLGEMAGGIAHEINNPLAIIHGKAAQLRSFAESGSLDANKVKVFAEKIERTAWRISKIIRGLRSFARNADHDPCEKVMLSSVIEDTLELCRERFKNYGVELRVPVIPELELFCRPSQISQVFLNLLNNAFDAILDKPIRWVELGLEPREDSVRISVTDSGAGIPPEIAEKMMQPFFTTKEVGKGTGLGLSISKGIIEDHGGALRLDSACANTCFRIELPRSGKSAQKARVA